MFDIKIINGSIVDGTGNPRYFADIGIIQNKIVKIGNLKNEQAKETINAENKIVSPGFIDLHTHSDFSIIYDPQAANRIYNGVTADVIGNCGIGAAPINEKYKELLRSYLTTRIAGSIPVKNLELKWNSFEEYLAFLDETKKAINIMPLLAHGAIRISEMGFENKSATKEQIKSMQEKVDMAMKEGALGLSSGLIYLPGLYTSKEELVEICKPMAKYGAKYYTHIRNEADDVFESIREAVYIAKKSGVGLHISHLKLAGPKVKGKTEELFNIIESEKLKGLDISFDVYPYEYGMTSLASLVDAKYFKNKGIEGMIDSLKSIAKRDDIKQSINNEVKKYVGDEGEFKGWEKFAIVNVTNESGKWMEGKFIPEIAKEISKEPAEAVIEILISQNAKVQMRNGVMEEQDVDKIVSYKDAMFGSDSMSMSNEGIFSGGKTHPRAFGTQGRILRKYVREKKLITLEDAIKRMTSLPTKLLKIEDLGLIKENYFANIVVFDEDKISDNATYDNPKQYTSGMDYVIVNGKVALRNKELTREYNGKVIKRKNNSIN